LVRLESVGGGCREKKEGGGGHIKREKENAEEKQLDSAKFGSQKRLRDELVGVKEEGGSRKEGGKSTVQVLGSTKGPR